jgi:hypothetical protein
MADRALQALVKLARLAGMGGLIRA